MKNWMRGHLSIGPVTIYGRNAMHWAVEIRTKRWGYICFRLPFTVDGSWRPLYFYVSPNATPWAATFYVGGEYPSDKRRATIRRRTLGHNFDVDANYLALAKINDYDMPQEGSTE